VLLERPPLTSRVVVLDYGSGNLRSAERALARAGADVTVTADLDAASEADGLVVPGVGAFAACMDGINAVRGGTVIWDRLRKGRPVLGICVGMQVLYETGVEHGERTTGLGVIAGEVSRMEADVVPQMGWNRVVAAPGSLLLAGV
jgi:glutamine amidotransferase